MASLRKINTTRFYVINFNLYNLITKIMQDHCLTKNLERFNNRCFFLSSCFQWNMCVYCLYCSCAAFLDQITLRRHPH